MKTIRNCKQTRRDGQEKADLVQVLGVETLLHNTIGLGTCYIRQPEITAITGHLQIDSPTTGISIGPHRKGHMDTRAPNVFPALSKAK